MPTTAQQSTQDPAVIAKSCHCAFRRGFGADQKYPSSCSDRRSNRENFARSLRIGFRNSQARKLPFAGDWSRIQKNDKRGTRRKAVKPKSCRRRVSPRLGRNAARLRMSVSEMRTGPLASRTGPRASRTGPRASRTGPRACADWPSSCFAVPDRVNLLFLASLEPLLKASRPALNHSISGALLCPALLALLGFHGTVVTAQQPKQQETHQQDQKLRELIDQVWDFELTESPLLATDVGDPRGQDRLADDSMAAIERRAEARQQFLDQTLRDLRRVSLPDVADRSRTGSPSA